MYEIVSERGSATPARLRVGSVAKEILRKTVIRDFPYLK
jgi:hypothetical protein